MYPEPPTTFEALLAPHPEPVQDIASWLRDLLLSEFPQLEENVSGGRKFATALYSVGGPNRVAVGMQPGGGIVKLFVHDPQHLPPTSFRIEGTGKYVRHVKLAEIPAGRRAEMVELVRGAVERRSEP